MKGRGSVALLKPTAPRRSPQACRAASPSSSPSSPPRRPPQARREAPRPPPPPPQAEPSAASSPKLQGWSKLLVKLNVEESPIVSLFTRSSAAEPLLLSPAAAAEPTPNVVSVAVAVAEPTSRPLPAASSPSNRLVTPLAEPSSPPPSSPEQESADQRLPRLAARPPSKWRSSSAAVGLMRRQHPAEMAELAACAMRPETSRPTRTHCRPHVGGRHSGRSAPSPALARRTTAALPPLARRETETTTRRRDDGTWRLETTTVTARPNGRRARAGLGDRRMTKAAEVEAEAETARLTSAPHALALALALARAPPLSSSSTLPMPRHHPSSPLGHGNVETRALFLHRASECRDIVGGCEIISNDVAVVATESKEETLHSLNQACTI
ncbi:proline-rich receptor-like protein kinase PERK10 [Ananas comosus]|uniref:Proline-rich receptor-like protein kinase PERK10 n=1 Tax=Ananas comosus TaxID=4615 RepID=A0A6P5G9Q0_ANACO|nr:proline-rich receptor-like protein kinase PERK10 [Ananas comosus]